MTLPATPKLDALVGADATAVDDASLAIASGAAAAAKLVALKSQLDDITALQTRYITDMTDGSSRLTAARAAADGLATGAYAATVAAITAVASGGLGNAAWKAKLTVGLTFTGVSTTTGAPASITASYQDLATARTDADKALVTKQATATGLGIDADRARRQLDAALAALEGFLTGVEADLAAAQRYFDSARVQVAARNFAGAWWSWSLADALVKGIDAADDSALMTALNGAMETYAGSVTALKTADADVVAALALQSRTAYNLGIADGKVRAALAATPPT
ncbi:MAG TPA: hypothetical protein VHT91_42835 [Kofleriaceae bacterium]|jgi:hypothetical protein|nr:hypothetical protein [Kofleriaceae bacterium]